MKALIIDDMTACQKMLERLLIDYAECDIVKNGEDGMKAFLEAHNENKPYDVIFLDIMMPGIDGIKLLKNIRKVETSSEKVKIIMATSLTDKKYVLEAIQYGCDSYLLKPYTKLEIEDQLKKLKLL